MESSSSREAIVSFLSRKENLKTALEIDQHLPAVKERLHRRFWNVAIARLEERLKDEGVDGWEVKGRNKYGLTEGLGGITLHPKTHGEREPVLKPNAEQKQPGNNWRLDYGLWLFPWHHLNSEQALLVTIQQKLRKGLQKVEGCEVKDQFRSPVYKKTRYHLRSREILLDMAGAENGNSSSNFAVDFADEFFEFFLSTKAVVTEVNKEVLSRFG